MKKLNRRNTSSSPASPPAFKKTCTCTLLPSSFFNLSYSQPLYVTGSFLPIQLIYQIKSKRCLSRFTFLSDFHVAFTANHWSNLEKWKDPCSVITFLFLTAKKNELGCQEERSSLIIMDTFRDQDNYEIINY